MIHVRHAAEAIAPSPCKTVLTTHGENDRSGVGRSRNIPTPTSLAGGSNTLMGQWAGRLCSRSRYCDT
jgi:hypothetical protein